MSGTTQAQVRSPGTDDEERQVACRGRLHVYNSALIGPAGQGG